MEDERVGYCNVPCGSDLKKGPEPEQVGQDKVLDRLRGRLALEHFHAFDSFDEACTLVVKLVRLPDHHAERNVVDDYKRSNGEADSHKMDGSEYELCGHVINEAKERCDCTEYDDWSLDLQGPVGKRYSPLGGACDEFTRRRGKLDNCGK